MNLGKAANYFSTTPVSGWNGTAWVPNITSLTFLPYDRFISEREFGNKRRFVMLNAADTSLDTYPVIKFEQTGEVYLVGVKNYDIQTDKYSQLRLVHRASKMGNLVSFTKAVSASGMAGSVSRTVVGQYYCDVEYVTFSNSSEFQNIGFPMHNLTFPSNVVITTEQELVIGEDYYTIQETYPSSGFSCARGMRKKSQ